MALNQTNQSQQDRAAAVARARFNPADLFKLFLIVAFPLHMWTILMALRDFQWVAEGRTFFGAIGYTAYVLVFTLVETVAVFGVFLLLGLLISKRWSKDQRLSLLGLLSLILSGWSILEQVILVLLLDRVAKALSGLTFLGTSPWIGFLVLAVLIAASFAIPTYLVLRSEKFTRAIMNFFDRLALLSGFYLFFDVVAILIVIVRNV